MIIHKRNANTGSKWHLEEKESVSWMHGGERTYFRAVCGKWVLWYDNYMRVEVDDLSEVTCVGCHRSVLYQWIIGNVFRDKTKEVRERKLVIAQRSVESLPQKSDHIKPDSE